MWYIIVGILLAIWVLLDASKRKVPTGRGIGWAIFAFILPVVAVPVYAAGRPLLAGEVREGGRGWNILRNFAITWTIVMAAAAIAGLVGVSGQPRPATDAEAAGAAIGTAVGLGFLAMVWFFPMVGAVVLGFILKKSSVVERGPEASSATP